MPPAPATRLGGAIRKQAAALTENLIAVLAGRRPTSRYDGYTVVPYTVSRRRVVFAEFDDRARPHPIVPEWVDLARERRLGWIFDRDILPWVYWHLITKGCA